LRGATSPEQVILQKGRYVIVSHESEEVMKEKETGVHQKLKKIRPIPFGERPGPEPYNASEVIALADSRFLFCDNNVSDALFELRLARDGSVACPLVRCPIEGLEPGAIDDIEGIELVRAAGRRFLFATSSLSLKKRNGNHRKKSKRGKVAPARESILRMTIDQNERLQAEIIPDFRPWLIKNSPELSKAARYLPDDNGLNVEALSWDPKEHALLFGIRTPVVDGKPLIIRIRPKKFAGPWELGNLEILPPLKLAINDELGEAGIRAMTLDQLSGITMITVGNSTSSSKAPFKLYSWDGNAQGRVRYFKDVRFHKKMKPEGVVRGKIGGRGAVVFVDDSGGYQFLWDDDPRLVSTRTIKRIKRESK
jgi:hypothetical protein